MLLDESPVEAGDVEGEQLIADAESALQCDSLTAYISSNQVKCDVFVPWNADVAQLEAADPPVVAISEVSDGNASARPPAGCVASVLAEETVENLSVDCEVVAGAVAPDAALFLSDEEKVASDVPASILTSEERIVSDPEGEIASSGTEVLLEETRPSDLPMQLGSDSPPTLLQLQGDDVTAEDVAGTDPEASPMDTCVPESGVLEEELLVIG